MGRKMTPAEDRAMKRFNLHLGGFDATCPECGAPAGFACGLDVESMIIGVCCGRIEAVRDGKNRPWDSWWGTWPNDHEPTEAEWDALLPENEDLRLVADLLNYGGATGEKWSVPGDTRAMQDAAFDRLFPDGVPCLLPPVGLLWLDASKAPRRAS